MRVKEKTHRIKFFLTKGSLPVIKSADKGAACEFFGGSATKTIYKNRVIALDVGKESETLTLENGECLMFLFTYFYLYQTRSFSV